MIDTMAFWARCYESQFRRALLAAEEDALFDRIYEQVFSDMDCLFDARRIDDDPHDPLERPR